MSRKAGTHNSAISIKDKKHFEATCDIKIPGACVPELPAKAHLLDRVQTLRVCGGVGPLERTTLDVDMNSEWDMSVIHQISGAVTMANRLLSGPAENPE